MLNYVQLNANCVCLQIGLQVASIVFNPGDDDGKKKGATLNVVVR